MPHSVHSLYTHSKTLMKTQLKCIYLAPLHIDAAASIERFCAYIISTKIYHAWIKKFSQRGSNVDNGFFSLLFLADKRRDDPNTIRSGPSSAHRLNAIPMAFRWRAGDGQTLNSGLVALWFFRGSEPVLLKNYFCEFS